ncbi:glycosyltransferase family 39 protein [Patescibacteria group bacterium]|nr:glycosyltransferase family 39 protein [Patescibacteria group bacterium]
MKKFVKQYPILIAIIILAFVLRLYKISSPILDWHSFRQADTASVTREFIKGDFNPLIPKYHDLSNIQSGVDNPEGYRMVEFPFYNIVVALILKSIPSLPLVTTGRIVSSLFSIGTLISLFFLARNYYGKKVGYFTAFFFAVLPYSVYYSRVIMPEPMMLFASTFSILAFSNYMKIKSTKWYWLSLFSLMIALLLKPFVAFLAPVYLAIILQERQLKKAIFDFRLYVFAILAVIPFFLWRNWISNFPAGIPASDWLFNGEIQIENSKPRFRPFWFRWLFWERITKLILGIAGVILLPVSFFQQLKNKKFLIPSWWLSVLIYFSVVATGNVRHDYYQVLIIPIICITLGSGILILDNYLYKKFNALVSVATITIIVALSLFFSYDQINGYYNINHPEYILAGTAADKLLPKDAKVIAPQYSDTSFLFQINRKGWPLGYDIDTKINMGATNYVTTTMDKEAKELEQKYIIIEKTGDYLILDLTQERGANN